MDTVLAENLDLADNILTTALFYLVTRDLPGKCSGDIFRHWIFAKWQHIRAAQCIDKEILISKNGNIDIDIEIDKRFFL